MEPWKAIASMKEFDSYTIVRAPTPEYDEDSYNLAFQRCEENKCGCFGTNWGCNPGARKDVASYYRDIDYVIVLYRSFELDFRDKEMFKTISDDVHRSVRRMMLLLRDNGLECDGYVDGPCEYCGKCAYPEPCRFPEMIVPSVSTLGISLKTYFDSIDVPFSFEDDRVTLYGFIFVKKSAPA